MPLLWWRDNSNLQGICSVTNIDYIKNELSKNKSVILFTAHTVSLDFGGRSISRFPIISMYKPFRNKLLNWFVANFCAPFPTPSKVITDALPITIPSIVNELLSLFDVKVLIDITNNSFKDTFPAIFLSMSI